MTEILRLTIVIRYIRYGLTVLNMDIVPNILNQILIFRMFLPMCNTTWRYYPCGVILRGIKPQETKMVDILLL